MTALALAVYGVLFAGAALVVWRRPIAALYVFVVGLAAHNLVMALLYGAGVHGNALEAIQAWKEGLLALAAARVAWDAVRARRWPFRPGAIDLLALAFGALVLLYAVLPQGGLGGHAGAKAILYGVRHDLVPVAAYFLGRALKPSARQLRAFGWTVLGAAAAVAAFGLIEEYTVPVEWWRHSGAVGYFHRQLGFDYHGPGGLPDNFAFNSSVGVFRRLVSTYVSPLATGFMLVVALLVAPRLACARRDRRLLAGLVLVLAAGLLFTISRSSVLALTVGFVVLALVRRRLPPLAAAAATVAIGVGFAFAFTHIAPRTHFFKEDLPYQVKHAREHGGLPGGSGVLNGGEPSLRSHLTNLREGLKTVARHPQGYGLGNAGATASRFAVPLKAGESNYTEIGVETGLLGMLLFIAWNLALLAGLVRAARAGDETMLWAAGGLAAALAAILALAIQTDIYGVPWIAYCVWWLAGSLTAPLALRVPALSRRAEPGPRRPSARTVLPRPGSDG